MKKEIHIYLPMYVKRSDGKFYRADDVGAKEPRWKEITDPEVLESLNAKVPTDLENFYPVAQAAQEAWEAD